jgi:hypothetical protein
MLCCVETPKAMASMAGDRRRPRWRDITILGDRRILRQAAIPFSRLYATGLGGQSVAAAGGLFHAGNDLCPAGVYGVEIESASPWRWEVPRWMMTASSAASSVIEAVLRNFQVKAARPWR